MSKSRSKAELEAELRLLRRQKTAGSIAAVLTHLITWAGVVSLAYFLFSSIRELSGKQTLADIGVTLIGDVRLSEVVAILFGGGGVVYGMRQMSLRRTTVERLQSRIRKLEEERDPGRTSSGLTTRGETHPKDK